MTDWEQRWKAGDTGWDHGEASPPLVEYLETNAVKGRVLVPGCGSGHDVRALAQSGADVLGLDIAPSALEQARRFPLARNERYQVGNWLDLAPALKKGFDWVVEHTCFCALHPSMRPAYVEAVDGALRPGGHFLAVFYLQPHSPSGPPFGVDEATLDAFFSRFECLRQWTPTQAYPGREGREQMRLYTKRG